MQSRTIRRILGVSGRVVAIVGGFYLLAAALNMSMITPPSQALRLVSYALAAQRVMDGLRVLLCGLLLFTLSRNLKAAKTLIGRISERLQKTLGKAAGNPQSQ